MEQNSQENGELSVEEKIQVQENLVKIASVALNSQNLRVRRRMLKAQRTKVLKKMALVISNYMSLQREVDSLQRDIETLQESVGEDALGDLDIEDFKQGFDNECSLLSSVMDIVVFLEKSDDLTQIPSKIARKL